MTFHRIDSPIALAVKVTFSTATAYRLQNDPRLPSQTATPRTRRRPDPLAGLFEEEAVPLPEAAPGPRPVALFEGLRRRHPELEHGLRRTLESRVRA
nr:hypothetical protein [Halomonas montanilacus]